MNMIEAVQSAFAHFTNWKGRASRSAYWWFALAHALSLALAMGVALASKSMVLYALVLLGFLLPSISVLVRRLHDTGHSGWWYWIGLVPVVGTVWLIVLLVSPSSPGDNMYGPDPQGGVSAPSGL